MKKSLKKIWKKITSKRVISFVLAVLLIVSSFDFGWRTEDGESVSMIGPSKVHAIDNEIVYKHLSDEEGSEDLTVKITIDKLSEYSEDCNNHREYHQFDKIIIINGGDTTFFNSGFKGLGSSDNPFGGSIELEQQAQNFVLNIDAPLFNSVYDNVVINNGTEIKIAREYGSNRDETTPILAKEVVHRGEGGATWKVNVYKPSDEEGASVSHSLEAFGGLIGTMLYAPDKDDSEEDKGAVLFLEVTMNGVTDNYGEDYAPAVIRGAGNLGFACGEMQEKTELTLNLESSRKIGDITTSTGSVGGLVGVLKKGAVFTYQNDNLQETEKKIQTAANGYAGGIVGECQEGKVILNSSPYSISQFIEGTKGAGGVYGYFQPAEAMVLSEEGDTPVDGRFQVPAYVINCQVNGAGYDGGLFGVLDSKVKIGIVGGEDAVISGHATGEAEAYGGLIGKYVAYAETPSLEITNGKVKTEINGTADFYGGEIGLIDDAVPTYVKFHSAEVNSSKTNALTYGGVVASADNAFVDVDGAKVTISAYKGGAIVGSLDHGILSLSGSVDLSNAIPSKPLNPDEAKKIGKVVGWRDDALVYAKAGCSLTEGNAEIDEIGAWGQVIRFNEDGFKMSDLLTEDADTHILTIQAPSDAENSYQTIASAADFAKTALCFQIDAANNSFLGFADTGSDFNTIKDKNITLKANLDLRNTGLLGLTRDNDLDSEKSGAKCVFAGTFLGKPETTKYSITFGAQTFYRHAYVGLFGIAQDVTVSNVVFDGVISANASKNTGGNPGDQAPMFVGTVAATAKGVFRADGLEIHTELQHAGNGELYLGGMLGEATENIGNMTFSGIKANAVITGSASEVSLGGVIGRIAHVKNEEVTWAFSDIEVAGSITNTKSLEKNRVGGLIADISGFNLETKRALELKNIAVNDFSIHVKANSDGSVGGLLGYAWKSVNTTFENVQVGKVTETAQEGADPIQTVIRPGIYQENDEATGVDLAGLVYQGTGYWSIDKKIVGEDSMPGIQMNAFSLKSDAADSFGMLVNKGWTGEGSVQCAIYLEEKAKDAILLSGDQLSFQKHSSDAAMTFTTFDEFVAYTAYYENNGGSKKGYAGSNPDDLYLLRNGQAIVSIKSDNESLLVMDGSNASGSYMPVTEYGKAGNPYSRYYYNLDTLRENPGTNAAKLMSWGARWYAHSSIKNYFTDNKWGSNIPNLNYDLTGYSWYPLNIGNGSTVNVNGTFLFYNREFEVSERVANTANEAHAVRTSLYDGGTTQHYLMHGALFYNVGGKLKVGDVTLKGSIPQINTGRNKYSGALVMGVVKGSGSTDKETAKVITTSVKLDGIYVYNFNLTQNDYAPLLINGSDDYSALTINGVRVNSDNSYPSDSNGVKLLDLQGNERMVAVGEDNYPKIATSLIGNAGQNENSKNINVNFTNIQLDARKERLALADLDEAYHTQLSLFTNATLLQKLTFDSGKGTYNYSTADDWTLVEGETDKYKHNVTYGKEVGYTDAETYADTQYPNLERWYLDNGNTTVYTDPTKPEGDGDGNYASTFVASYLPYVYSAYHKTQYPKQYQLEVNHGSASFSGCGTYNDPYLITKGGDFDTICSILKSDSAPGAKIDLPMKDADHADLTATWHNDATGKGHQEYQYKGVDPNDSSKVAGYYLGGDYNKQCLTPKEVRTYVAGAYYKLDPAKNEDGTVSNTITISGETFQGLGNTSDEYAYFRGVIVGNGNQFIENKTDYPLIAISNGSVIKDINFLVDKGTQDEETTIVGNIIKEQKSAEAFPASKNYGAIIGAVMGGDNIIDGVTVTFQNTTITLSGSHAQLIPVGGYVGVIVNGGVIFRGMEGKTSGISGIPADSTIVRYGTGNAMETDLVAEGTKRWLYVNPIIGRVINGYAVTEASAYRPFEDGVRKYGDGTSEYWLETKSGNTITSSVSTDEADKGKRVGVTMRNGNKHYSIADIKSAWGKEEGGDWSLTYEGNGTSKKYLPDEEKLNLVSKTNVSVPNGQSFFLMSLMVSSGMAKKTLGYNQDYQVSRSARYGSVKKDLSLAAANCADYNNYAKNDNLNNDSNTSSDRAGYLAKYYTTNEGNAVDMAEQSTTLTLSTNEGYYVLPDGYKGLGSLYRNDNNCRMKVSTFNGNESTISQNTTFYYYFKKNGSKSDRFDKYYPSQDANYLNPANAGFGLINYQNSAMTAKNIILTGNVIADAIDSSNKSGGHVPYYGSLDKWNFEEGNGIDRKEMLSVGSLMGYVNQNVTLENVALNNVYVKGLKGTGGLFGIVNGGKTSITVTNHDFDKVKIHGASNTGGLIGRKHAGSTEIDFHNRHFNISEVVCECENRYVSDKFDANYGVGGIIGLCRSDVKGYESSVFRNINIGTEDQTTATIIKCENAKIFTGGLAGLITRTNVEISNCNIYNLDLMADYCAGGLVGQIATVPNARNYNVQAETFISNVNIVSNDSMPSGTKARINTKGEYAGGFIGAGKSDLLKNVYVSNSSISGYEISSTDYTGGVAGIWGYAVDGTVYKNDLVLRNFLIEDCTIKDGKYLGGLVGLLNLDTQSIDNKKSDGAQYLKGYNILAKNISFESDNMVNQGYLVGKNQKAIQIVGFSRQDDRGSNSKMIQDLVGVCTSSTSNIYGSKTYNNVKTEGYVIFADYNDYASTQPWALFSNVSTGGVNIATMRSKATTVVDGVETVVYGNYDSIHEAANTETGYVDGNTVIKNDNYPYVTSSKKTMIDTVHYLTGDGISTPEYEDSTLKTILTDMSVKRYTCFKRYDKGVTNVALTEEDIRELEEHYSNTAEAYNNNANVIKFPLLVVDDVNTANTTRLINHYVNALANTNYNYADETTNSSIYKVELKKCVFDADSSSATYKQFVIVNDEACLKRKVENISGTSNPVFYMEANDVDTGSTPQFTLMDVQYLDPTDATKIAYHLYIPIYVNQLLRYRFQATLASNTDYYPNAYINGSTYMFENLGNPVSMKLEYEYVRTPSEWAEAINNGMNVLSNYYKTLNVNTQNRGWPANSRLVLVDATNQDKFYYLDSPATKCTNYIDLYDFVENDGTTHFKPAPLQNVMNLKAVKTTAGMLTPTANNSPEGATVYVDGVYYRPITEGDSSANYYRVISVVDRVYESASGSLVVAGNHTEATVESSGAYYRPATEQELADGNVTKYHSSSFDPERYYLSIFTKKTVDATIYHLELQSRETFEKNSGMAKTTENAWTVEGWRPNKMLGNNTQLHLILGDLYENKLELSVTPMDPTRAKPQLMDEENYSLAVKMTASVKLKKNATDNGVDKDMYSHTNSSTIYQTFLMTFDKLDTIGGQSVIGLDPNAKASFSQKSYYLAPGEYTASTFDAEHAYDILTSSEFLTDSESYMELRNKKNLINYLANSSAECNNAVTLQVGYEIVYAYRNLSYQFPVKRDDSDSIGTKVLAYSNVSSSVTGAAYSATSLMKEDDKRYYTNDDVSASLTYNVVQTMTKANVTKPGSDVYGGRYSYLGVNAYEIEDGTSYVESNAVYDLRDLSSTGDYVEFTLSLSQKGDYLQPVVGNPHNSGTALELGKYLRNLKIYGQDMTEVYTNDEGETAQRIVKKVLYDLNQDVLYQAEGAGNEIKDGGVVLARGSLNSDKNMITLRVKKSLLRSNESGDIFYLPISYEVITGDATFNQNGLKYANYKVSITAACYPTMDSSEYKQSSYVYDHLIYTNAQVDPTVVVPES